MAANTFMLRYMSVSFMPAFGISAAVTALAQERQRLGVAVLFRDAAERDAEPEAEANRGHKNAEGEHADVEDRRLG